MASNQSDVTDNPPASDTTIDWSSEFQSPAFLTGLRTAFAGLVSPGVNLESHSTQLEKLGDALPSRPGTSTPATGISTVAPVLNIQSILLPLTGVLLPTHLSTRIIWKCIYSDIRTVVK